ncbi:MAG: biotin carboxylase [Lysobacterales bacterium]|nr:MAG: biotin carboxylase [Xanthomonadales bacterium]
MNNSAHPPDDPQAELSRLLEATRDRGRPEAVAARHARGYRTARENLEDLCDPGSFVEYGQLAVAAQRQRRSLEDLRGSTPADGVITGLATINAERFGPAASQAAVIVYDYTVLAGTQGWFHHKKLDRILDVAERERLPVVMYTEGGGGRPGDTDVSTQIAGLDLPTFARWAGLAGRVPRIAVANGFCFAGNAALFGCADLRLATRSSWIGMAGPAMIEGGGLGRFEPTAIGPVDVQSRNGVIDRVCADEAEATVCARALLGYFQGAHARYDHADQAALAGLLPVDRRYSYHVRRVIDTLADSGTFMELGAGFGAAIVTGFIRIEGRPLGLLANDCRVLGGAIDANAAEKAARFLRLCSAHGVAVLTLCDTPGFMVGPDSEKQAAVRHMSDLFVAGARLEVPLVTIFLRKAYGLGAMAMAGGSFAEPVYAAAWPSGEFGGMGLEGAVRLGYRKELEAEGDPEKQERLFNSLLAGLYAKGRAIEAATHLEIDAVIDPADTRRLVSRAFAAAAG